MPRASIVFPTALLAAMLLPAGMQSGVKPIPQTHRTDSAIEPGAIVPRTVIVKLRPGALLATGSQLKPSSSLNATMEASGVQSARQLFPASRSLAKSPGQNDPVGLSRLFILDLRQDLDPLTAVQMLSSLPEIEYAEPKYYHTLCDSPNDPLVTNQTSMYTRVHAFDGWTLGKGSPSVIIADVDGGTYWQHEDLLTNIHVKALEDINHNGEFDSGDLNGIDDDGNGFIDDVIGWNFANATGDPRGLSSTPESFAHGTATASHCCAVANNGIGMAGSSWNCGLMPICVASSTSDKTIAYGYEGIVYAFQNGASVINCSWGRTGGFSQFEEDVIAAAADAGALVVAAAGNDGTDNDYNPHYPSDYAGVLAVGSTNSTSDVKAYFSNYGKSVEVYAPGVNIISAFTSGSYGNGGSGTSYSSPLVAGLAGLLRALHADWTPAKVASQIRSTADAIDNVNTLYAGSLGRGRVNFSRALSESHAAVDPASGTLLTSHGQRLFLIGDTLVLSMRLKNVGGLPVAGCQVVATPSDTALETINGSASISQINVGEEVELPAMKFRVRPISTVRKSTVSVVWTYNSTEQDAAVYQATLFPVVPLWLMRREGSSASLHSVCAVNRSVVWASGGDGSGTTPLVLRSTNAGQTWSEVVSGLAGYDFYCINAIDANRAWVGTSDGRIFATTDGGANWSSQTYPGRQSPFIDAIRMFADGTGYALGDPPGDGKFVVLKTTDFGITWNHLANEPGLSTSEAGWNNSFWWIDQNHGWFGTNENRVWYTTDGGSHWSSGATGGTNSYGVAFNDAANGFAIHDNGYVARSTDGGATWSGVSISTTDQMAGVACVPGSRSAWVTDGSIPYRTRDDGDSWVGESLYPISGSLLHMSFVDSTCGWAVTSNGEAICYDPFAFTSVTTRELPSSFALVQNYPNPFNPVTSIGYTVGVVSLPAGQAGGRSSVAAHVRLAVYDLLGREVAVLVNERKAPGRYEVQFNGRGIASGVYFYRFQVSGGGTAHAVETRKMMLLR